MEILYENLLQLTWQQALMWAIGGLLIYLAIKKDMEPALLLPMGFGAILVNLPFSGAVGAILLMLSDTIGKIILAPVSIPVGIVVSFLGVPLFINLILTRKKGYLR